MNVSSEKTENGVCIVQITGTLDGKTVEEFKERFEDEIGEANQCIFDMSELAFLDSAGLGGLLSCLKKMIQRDGDLRIASLGQKARLVFDITRAHKVFEIFDTTEQAKASFE